MKFRGEENPWNTRTSTSTGTGTGTGIRAQVNNTDGVVERVDDVGLGSIR